MVKYEYKHILMAWQKKGEEYNKYMREYHSKRYYRLRGEAISFLGGKCVVCCTSENLQLDHIDHTTKEIEVSRLLSVSLKRFWAEVKKCQILCRKCHSDKTLKDLGKKKAKGVHGTISSYRYCKCEECREAAKENMKKYYKTHKRIIKNGIRVVVPV
jgi:5-methylcytosine-specific restriction endonuclease McrA